MREWVPTTRSAKGRLVVAALAAFGAQGYADVGVGQLATAAGVTTGSLYHHFGSKQGLYSVVRADVEQRVVDRMEGAAAGRAGEPAAARAKAALLVGFDYVTGHGFARLLAEQPQPDASDAIEAVLIGLLGDPLGRLVAAAWRTALAASVDSSADGGADGGAHGSVQAARDALSALLPVSPGPG